MGLLGESITDTALVAATSLYARWLDKHKDLEPDHTWAEVTFGVGLCLVHAAAVAQQRGQHWTAAQHSLNHLRSFALGGTPVIVGELWQWRERLQARAAYRPPEPVEG